MPCVPDALCLLSWKLMLCAHWAPTGARADEQARISIDPLFCDEGGARGDAGAAKKAIGEWMKAAWVRNVNGLAYGTL